MPAVFGYVPASAVTSMAHGPDLVVALVTAATVPLRVAEHVLVTLIVVSAATTPRLTE